MTRRTLAVVALTLFAGAVLAVALAPATCQAQTAKVTSLSRATAKVGARLTIRGSYFGSRQGSSTVTFGERRNALGNAPCAKKARVISWSRSSITVRVPSMAPGPHKVYVTVGGRASNSSPFSITAATMVTGRTFSTASRIGATALGSTAATLDLAAYTHNVLFEDCTFEATDQNIPGDLPACSPSARLRRTTI